MSPCAPMTRELSRGAGPIPQLTFHVDHSAGARSMDDISVLFALALFWIGFAIVVAIAAGNKGRNPVGWALLAFVISPLLAGLFLLVVRDLKTEKEAQLATLQRNGDTKACPRCAENVKKATLVCRFCGFEFPPWPQPAPNVAHLQVPLIHTNTPGSANLHFETSYQSLISPNSGKSHRSAVWIPKVTSRDGRNQTTSCG